MRARVIVLTGPSGAGKTRLANRLGLPVLRLDDFYKDASDPSLPVFTEGPNAGLVDWDDPATWSREDAVAALTQLCETGRARVPVYDIARSARTGWQELDLGAHRFVVAEGIFAADVVGPAREAGLLAAAYCITRPAPVTFGLRLTRDLYERRKPPAVLVKRGVELMHRHPATVADAVAKGCTPASPNQAYAAVRRLLAGAPTESLPWGPRLKQPDAYSCGATALVVAQMLRDPAYAAATLPRFDVEVQRVHRSFRFWPHRLGTAFWSLDHGLAQVEGVAYDTRVAYLRPGRAFDQLHHAAAHGHLAALYVGTATLPRHIALVVGVHGSDLAVFDPASGHVVQVSRAEMVGHRLRLGGWPRIWTTITPREI